IELSDKMADDFVQAYVGKEVEVLFERVVEDGVYEGHTTNYIKVKATSDKDLTNIICTVAVTKAENEELFGTAKA
ncbi:MAG: tRNA (N(6)-L-threonylcarbamoyladenosine(37)-C(2))-methylthiotransferase MtaB, partial [Anaerotignum sp.]|nr:tRNA (N(6)-L-threonylcarbamoyladenosine(37)-C(2))-methylthiotransferase MtaB [Anaerotignum sp.]